MRIKTDSMPMQLYKTLDEELKDLNNAFNKIMHKVVKRGLINILGSAIKFITGNLDNDDLVNLKQNIEEIKNSQYSEISKISKLASFASHITKRYEEDIIKINLNIEETERIIHTIHDELNILQLINNELFNVLRLQKIVKIIERTITLAKLETPNLELFTSSDLLEIIKYLNKVYNTEQIINIDTTHLFEVLDQSKVLLAITSDAVIIVLKIPILKSSVYKRYSIYPVPNQNDKIVVPPAKYYLKKEDSYEWTNQCATTRNQTVCFKEEKFSKCTLADLDSCDVATVTNNYRIITELENNALLVVSKKQEEIIEKCKDVINKNIIQNNNLILSKCDLIIGDSTFKLQGPNFTIDIVNATDNIELKPDFHVDLKKLHLEDIQQLHKDIQKIEEPTFPQIHYVHLSITGLIILIIIIILSLICYFRKNLIKNLFGKKKTITIAELKKFIPNWNEDVQS